MECVRMTFHDQQQVDSTQLNTQDVTQGGSHTYHFVNVANMLESKDVIHDHNNPKSLAQ